MKLEIDFDVKDIEADKADGQVNIKLPKEQELKFRLLNVKYNKRLSKIMRKVAIQLVEQIEAKEKAS
jgi:hypothetical protein